VADTETPRSLNAWLKPFDSVETRRIRQFRKQIERLSSYRFLRESVGPMQLRATIAAGRVGDIRYVGPGSEALDHADSTVVSLAGRLGVGNLRKRGHDGAWQLGVGGNLL
jgi:hypothetical protein